MLSIATGHSVKYLTDQVATGRENYYSGAVTAGEPPGRWYGAGAEALGLSGLVDTQDMTALYEKFIDPRDPNFRDPSKWTDAATLGHTGRAYKSEEELYKIALDAEPNASPERREELRLDAGKRARKNVPFIDATFSVQKSVTVLHTAFEAQQVKAQRRAEDVSLSPTARAEAAAEATAWGAHKQAVEDAIWAGNHAMLDFLADKAGYSRIGHHGGAGGRWIDGHDWVAASFFQHDSRDHDPQLHIHNPILNRVQCADGQWRTLDSKAIHKFRPAAAVVGERTMEAHLSHALGVVFATRPDGKAREILGIPQTVLDLFSTRRRAVTAKTKALVAAFERQFDREPTALELDRLQRQATLATRKAKSHDGETVEQRLERWNRQVRAEIDGGLATVAEGALAAGATAPPVAEWSEVAVIETALAELDEKKSAFTEADLTRAISNALPDQLGDLDGSQVTDLLQRLTTKALASVVPLDAARPGDEALTPEYQLANGRSAFDQPGGRWYATPEHVRVERALVEATAARTAPALAKPAATVFVTSVAECGIELSVDQAAAVRGVLTSGAAVESLVGPAGTGKSFVVGVVAKAWQDPALWEGCQRRVFGLATSQVAADVLAGEGVTAANTVRWLAAQHRLAAGGTGGDDEQWRLRAGDLVVVDEYSMADTTALAAIYRRAHEAGAKVLLTGDHRQLAAVGAGGVGQDMAEAGISYELTEARRFREKWERAASLQLRAGDQAALGEYHKHGRLIDAGTVEDAEQSAARAWLADTLGGRRSMLIVDSNEQAARLSATLRAELVRLGRVIEDGVPLSRQGTYAGVGDLVQARRNGWHLAGYEGNRRGPINREQYRVLDTRADGGLVVAPILGRTPAGDRLGARMTLPGWYVAEHVELGYASTVYAAQGVTVDTSHGVVTPATRAEALYVQLTRGRARNTAHVATVTVPADPAVGTAKDTAHKAPMAVLATMLEAAAEHRSATATATVSAEEAASVRTAAERLAAVAENAAADRTARLLDELVGAGHLSVYNRQRLAGENGVPTLTRVLRRAEVAGHDPRRVLAKAVTARLLTDARRVTNVLHERITALVRKFDPRGDSFSDWAPKSDDPGTQRLLDALGAAADARRDELGRQVAEECPQWAIEAWGQPPTDEVERAAWTRRAGIVSAHRELTGHDDPVQALGSAPKAGQVEAYASWRASWRALGRDEPDNDERNMSNGRLRMRKRAWERESAWGPRYVANDLAATRQAAERHRHTAVLRAAEAETASDPAERTRLGQEARDAAAVADTLDAQIGPLEQTDHARAVWWAYTSPTRSAADRADAELHFRKAADDREDEQLVTAEEWLAAQRESERAEDPHREITDETDLVDVTDDRARDRAHVDQTDADTAPAGPVAESDVPDVREVAALEPRQVGEDQMRVSAPEQSTNSLAGARRTLVEIRNRDAMDAWWAAEEARAEQMARWHSDDQTTAAAGRDADRDPAVDYA